METYFNYIIESGLSLGVFTLTYWLFLRKETMLNASRVYLLVALLFSTFLPFLTINVGSLLPAELPKATHQANITPGTNLLETVTIYASGIPLRVGHALVSAKPSVWFYVVGALLALIVVMFGIIQILSLIARNRTFRLRFAHLVVTKKTISPYSFFNFIFISNELTREKNWKTMVHHELEHVKQGHSFDVLFIDFMMVFQWFNPFYWAIRQLVRENHEFLADRAVLRLGEISTGNYKALLLSQAIGGRPVITSNFFNVKTIQKRFKMISKNRSGKLSFLKYSFGLVIAIAMTLLFACEKTGTDETTYTEGQTLIYKDKIVQIADIQDLNIQKIFLARVEASKVTELYPNLKGKLPKGVVTMLFDSGNSNDVSIAQKLHINTSKSTSNFADDLPSDVFIMVDEMPEFPGGGNALREWISQNVKYPTDASENGIQGKVYVNFVIDETGEVTNAKIVQEIAPSLDAEALRVVEAMPSWTPGKQKGKPVKVSYTVPIKFSLK